MAWYDYNRDDWPDVYIGNYRLHRNFFWENQGNGTFLDIAAAAGVENPTERTFGMVFEDYDNDGWLDIFLPALDPGGPPSRIYRNDGNLTFSEAG